jgi:hypothetical protein
MLVFIDDSGDAGFKLDKGSSKHFVIACVIFDDNLDAEEAALKIKRLRRSLNWRDDHEFKFNKASKTIRLAFLNEVLSKSDGSILEGRIRLDGHEDRAYKKAATTYFRQQANPRGGVIKDMKFVNSKNDSLIQLADMTAGSILRTTQDNKTDRQEYFEVIKRRVEDIWNFK